MYFYYKLFPNLCALLTQPPTSCPATLLPIRHTLILTLTSFVAFLTQQLLRTARLCWTTTSPLSRCTSGLRPWLFNAQTCWEAWLLVTSHFLCSTLQPHVVTLKNNNNSTLTRFCVSYIAFYSLTKWNLNQVYCIYRSLSLTEGVSHRRTEVFMQHEIYLIVRDENKLGLVPSLHRS